MKMVPFFLRLWLSRLAGVLFPLAFAILAGCGAEEEKAPAGKTDAGKTVPSPTSAQRDEVPTAESEPIKTGAAIFPETEALLGELPERASEFHRQLAKKTIPNLVKGYDQGPPIEYDADYSWHSLKKEKQCPLPRSGSLGVINPNTELNYLIGFEVDDQEVRFNHPAETILHGVDFLAERCDLGEGLRATVTFLPYDSGSLLSFVELENKGAKGRQVRIHQLLEKEVFQYRSWPTDRLGRRLGPNSRRMAGVWVGTRGMKRGVDLPDGSALVFAEWEAGSLEEVGEILALMGGDREPDNHWTEIPPNTKPAPHPTEVLEPSVFHRGARVYGFTVRPGEKARLAGFLALRRYSARKLFGPRAVRPYLHGDESAALADCRKRIERGLKVDWKTALGERVGAYERYPLISLPVEPWESAFLCCLELPRAETVNPSGTMPIPYYNFCRAYGNELRRWWSYGEHGHESLSTFVTSLTDPGLAQIHLRGHLINQDPDGGFPYGVNQQSGPGIRSFAASAVTCPFIAWESWNAYLWGGDKAFLREAFDACSRSHAWWLRTRDRTGEGLCCWLDFGETVRDDGTVPTWRYEGAPVFFQEALDLNCYLLNMERVLSEMAAQLGEDYSAEQYREAWRKRARTMNAYMWHPEDECYYGLSEISDVFVQVKDISTLMPLWCGLAPVDRAERLMNLYRDPNHFATPWPVPVLSVSEPTYLPDGHWHGGNWVEMSWLVILGLKNYGYYEEAARLAEKNVTMVFRELERVSHLREYFDSKTGQGLSLLDYIWTSMPGVMIVDVFLGIRPTAERVEILPSLPETWSQARIEGLHLRGKRLALEVKRSPSVTAATASVNGVTRAVIDGRGIGISWEEWEAMPAEDVSVVIEQPPEIAERISPPRALPEDVLEPLAAHARIRPTSEELSFQSPFLHYAVNPVRYVPPPVRQK